MSAQTAAPEQRTKGLPLALANFNELPDSALVPASTVKGLYGVFGEATLWKWEKAGRIPPAIRAPGSIRKYWRVGELRAALAAMEANHAPA